MQTLSIRGFEYPSVAPRTPEDYQKCQVRNAGRVKEAESILMLNGNRLLMTCNVCLSPKSSAVGIWRRLDANSALLIPVALNGRRVRIHSDLSLEISITWERDSGIYFCLHNNKVYAQYAVTVRREEPHRYVILTGKRKKQTWQDLPLKDLNLIIGMQWSEWSPCSQCDKVGRRRRVGICSVRKLDPKKPSLPVDAEVFNEYRKGIPCRSSVLPEKIKKIPAVEKTKSEFVISFCKIPCPTSAGIVYITDKNGKVIDTADNSKGIYSLHQPLPKLPALASRKTIYEQVGQSIILTCPGNSDGKFLIWRNDSYIINPSRVHIKTKGRVKIDLANNLHIRKLIFSDAAVYSCWDNDRLVGTIRLQVNEKTDTRKYRIYILNLGVIFTFITVFSISITLCKNAKLETKK